MEKNSKRISTAAHDLLSQSYNNGIQKLLGHEHEIPRDFQMPPDIMEKREVTWDNLFKKYSSMVSEAELNIMTLQPDEIECSKQTVEQRLPMRKPMSMVRYWVETGNQPYIRNTDSKTHSDSGSSLAEEDFVESAEAINLPCPSINSSQEKQSETPEISGNKCLRLASSSSSSVDTAAYILANNNTTKKAETIAIVEGSKVVDQKQNNSSQLLKPVGNVKSADKNLKVINVYQKKCSSEEIVQRGHNLKVNHFNDNVVDETHNRIKECDLDETKTVSKKSTQEPATGSQSMFASESDESLINSKYNNGVVQRKKLYKNTESPAEFTPVSEDNTSHRAVRLSLKPCEHPAFQTPKLSSRPSYLVNYQRQRLKKKKHRRLFSSMSSKIEQKSRNKLSINDTQFDSSDNSQNENTTKSRLNLKVTFKENCNENSRNSGCLKNSLAKHNNNKYLDSESSNDIADNSTVAQHAFERKRNLSIEVSSNDFKKFKLKHVFLTLHRLPYIYENIKANSVQEKVLNSEILHQEQAKSISISRNHKAANLNVIFSDDDDFMNQLDDLFKKSTENTTKCIESLTEKGTHQNSKLNRSEIKQKTASTIIESKNNCITNITATCLTNDEALIVTPHEKSNIRKSRKDRDQTIFDKSTKYVLVISSSDESESLELFTRKKLRKKSLKRKIKDIDEKSVDSSENTKEESLLNLNSRKRRSTEFSPAEIKSKGSAISLKFSKHRERDHHESLFSPSDLGNILPVTKINVKSNKKTIISSDENPVDSSSTKKKVQRVSNTSPIENDLQSLKIKSNKINEIGVVNSELINKQSSEQNKMSVVKKNKQISNLSDTINKIKSKSNDNQNLDDSFCSHKNGTKSFKSADDKHVIQTKNTKPFKDINSKEHVQSRKRTLSDRLPQDLKEMDSNRMSKHKSNKDTAKDKRLSVKNQRKSSTILILSDEECIIPLKMKSIGEESPENNKKSNKYGFDFEELLHKGIFV